MRQRYFVAKGFNNSLTVRRFEPLRQCNVYMRPLPQSRSLDEARKRGYPGPAFPDFAPLIPTMRLIDRYRADVAEIFCNEAQPAWMLNALVAAVLSGSVNSVVTVRASSVSSLVCAAIASNPLRACAVDSSMNSGRDFTPNNSWA